MLRVAEHNHEHELTGSAVLKGEGWELKIGKLSRVEEMNDLPALNRVPGKAVRMPRENTIRFSSRDALEHSSKHAASTPWPSAFFLKERFDDQHRMSVSVPGEFPPLWFQW